MRASFAGESRSSLQFLIQRSYEITDEGSLCIRNPLARRTKNEDGFEFLVLDKSVLEAKNETLLPGFLKLRVPEGERREGRTRRREGEEWGGRTKI